MSETNTPEPKALRESDLSKPELAAYEADWQARNKVLHNSEQSKSCALAQIANDRRVAAETKAAEASKAKGK